MNKLLSQRIRVDLGVLWEKTGKENLLGRDPEPEDVAPEVLFLASDESYYITGQIIEARGMLAR